MTTYHTIKGLRRIVINNRQPRRFNLVPSMEDEGIGISERESRFLSAIGEHRLQECGYQVVIPDVQMDRSN